MKTKEMAEQWLFENRSYIKIIEWNGGWSKPVVLFNTKNNQYFQYNSFSDFKRNRNDSYIFGATKKEKYEKQKISFSKRTEEQIEQSNIKRENTNLIKYNKKNVSQVEEIIQKKIPKLKAAYPKSKEKAIKTMKQLYGVESAVYISGVLEKIANTNLKKTGYKCVFQIPEVRKKTIESSRLINKFNKNNPNWKGGTTKLSIGIRNLPKYKETNKEVLKRDYYKCILCNSKKNLQIDHIKPLCKIIKENNLQSTEEAINCKELWDKNNLRTLCEQCHRKTDTWGVKALKYE